jgi:hypothetical protein
MEYRYTSVPVHNNKQGWGVAAFIVLLAVGAAVSAYMIHKRTYQHPRAPIDMLHTAAPAQTLFVG